MGFDAGKMKIGPETRVLELGCGKNKKFAHSVAVDISQTSQADVIHDLNAFPYPFGDCSFDAVICEHVLEHLDDFVKIIEEIHRILVPDGLLYVESPHFTCVDAYTDPTHKRFFTSSTFDYFSPDSSYSDLDYSSARFKINMKRIVLNNRIWKPRILEPWINRHLSFYEKHIAFMWTAKVVRFELAAIK